MNYKDINDYELIYMIAEDSDNCMQMILEKYKPLIHQQTRKWASIYRKLGFEMEDIEQEIYCAIVVAIRKYDEAENTSLYTYLLSVIEYQMIALVRTNTTNKKQGLNLAVSLSDTCGVEGDITLQDFLIDQFENVEKKIEQGEIQKLIKQFCYDLSVEHAQIFELYLEGFSTFDIATLLDLKKEKVNQQMLRLRRRLKRYFESCGVVELSSAN